MFILLISRQIVLILIFTLLLSQKVEANPYYLDWLDEELTLEEDRRYSTNLETNSPSQYVNKEVWTLVHDFLLPDNHPIKKQLDEIFSTSRALCDLQSMEAAGFEATIPQHHTQIIVTKHPKLKGYVIKAYLDIQAYHSEKPEYYFWIKRIRGAKLIDKAIHYHNYKHLLKVPKKWIYLLPDEPSPPPEYLRKMFILVEEDMNIYNDKKNQELWGSELVTKELLRALYTILTELGLFDCAKPSNCPISQDGRVAFVDTQSYYSKRVKYHKLTPYLSPSMQKYWLKLTEGSQ